MNSTKVKICGITNLEDAKFAVQAGANYLGFNFYEKSPRYISPLDAQVIIRQLPATCEYIGVFVNHSREEINHIAKQASLTGLQFHGDENLDFCKNWDSYTTIKAIRVSETTTQQELLDYSSVCDFLLLDAYNKNSYGGTGEQIKNVLLEKILSPDILKRTFLAGGLNPNNVRNMLICYQPFAVDTASGIEQTPKIKDKNKILEFIKQIKAVN